LFFNAVISLTDHEKWANQHCATQWR